jgi:hypothetical protein
MLLVPVPTADVSIVLKQQEFLADYLYVSLSGTLGRWQEYLAQKSLQPQLFQTLQLDIDPGQRLHYRSKRFDLTVTPAMVKLSKDTLLNLLTSFYVDGGKVVWDVGGLAVQESATKPDFMDVTRVGAPDDSLPQGFQSAWARMGAHEYPFNAMVFMNNGSTRIRTVADVNASASAKVHYVLTVVGEGTQTQKAMSKALGLLQRSFKLLEH